MLQLVKIGKTYTKASNEIVALQDISIKMPSGSFLAIQGKSGSGKSTMLNLIGCLDRPVSGTYYVDSKDTGRISDDGLAGMRNSKFGFIFQSFNLLPRFTALENVMLPFLYSSKQPSDPKKQAIKMLEKVGLGDRIKHLPGELSGGQQQRVAIARALVNDPSVILADEPTGSLDTHSGREIMDILSDLNKEGKTIIIVTHEQEIADHCLYMLKLVDGRILDLQKSSKPSTDNKAEVKI